MPDLTKQPLNQSQQWQIEKRRARLLFSALVAIAIVPVIAICFWLLGWPLVIHVWLPVQILAYSAVILGIAVSVIVVKRAIRGFQESSLDSASLKAIDQMRMRGRAFAYARGFWNQRIKAVLGDPWRISLMIAITFSIGLNTYPWWGNVAQTLWGGDFQLEKELQEPIVGVLTMDVVSPLTGKITDHSSSDGYLQVHEGAEISWLIEPLVPATYVTIYYGERSLTLPGAVNGQYAFQAIATEPTAYWFAAGKWGVRHVEAIPRRIEVLPDLPPEPAWVEQPPSELDGSEVISFTWRASDDRAVTTVALLLEGEDERYEMDLEYFPAGTDLTPDRKVLLDPSELPAGDQVILTLLAYDNDRFQGPNIGRSDPITLRLNSLEVDHDEWQTSLLSYLRRQTRFLGPAIESAWQAKAWRQFMKSGVQEATQLATTARELVAVSENLPMHSVNAGDTLLSIARLYDNVAQKERSRDAAIADIEEATWRTDELIGAEEAARLEHQEGQVISRLEQLSDDITSATDSELERMLSALEREMSEIAKSAKTKRPQMPTELLQKDAFKAEKQSERVDLMQQIREAIKNGDRERAKELMDQLLEQMRNAREQGAEAASSWQQSGAGEQELGQRARELEELQQRQEAAAQQMDQAQEDLNQVADDLEKELANRQRRVPRDSEEGRALQKFEQAMRKGDEDAATEALQQMSPGNRQKMGELKQKVDQAAKQAQQIGDAQQQIGQATEQVQEDMKNGQTGSATVQEMLDQARGKMSKAETALSERKPGEGANQGWQAAEDLGKAANAVKEQLSKMQEQKQGGQQFADYGKDQKPGRDGDETSDDFRGDEEFQTPEQNSNRQSGRDEVLQGFRRGLPDPGRSVNKRYLDRLLH